MPDPFSITTGVLALLQVTVTIANELKQLRDGASVVYQTISELANNIDSLRTVLESMRDTFGAITAIHGSGHIATLWNNVSRSIEDGKRILGQLESLVQEINKETSLLDQYRKQLRLNRAEQKIAGFRVHVQSYRDGLHLSLQAIILWNQMSYQKTAEQVLPNLGDLHSDVRRIAADLNGRIDRLQTLVSSQQDEMQVVAMSNLRECVRAAASTISSASTIISSAPDMEEGQTVAASDFGDLFPPRPSSVIRRWMDSQTVYEYDDVAKQPPRSVVDEAVEGEVDGGSDSDAELESEMTRLLLEKGKQKLSTGDIQGAEKMLRNCLSRCAIAGPAKGRKEALVHLDVLNHIYRICIEQHRWSAAQDMLLQKMTIRERVSGKEDSDFLWDDLYLARLLAKQKETIAAHLHARRALKGFKKLQSANEVERCLGLLIELCEMDGNENDAVAYAVMLEESRRDNNETEESPTFDARMLADNSSTPSRAPIATEGTANITVDDRKDDLQFDMIMKDLRSQLKSVRAEHQLVKSSSETDSGDDHERDNAQQLAGAIAEVQFTREPARSSSSTALKSTAPFQTAPKSTASRTGTGPQAAASARNDNAGRSEYVDPLARQVVSKFVSAEDAVAGVEARDNHRQTQADYFTTAETAHPASDSETRPLHVATDSSSPAYTAVDARARKQFDEQYAGLPSKKTGHAPSGVPNLGLSSPTPSQNGSMTASDAPPLPLRGTKSTDMDRDERSSEADGSEVAIGGPRRSELSSSTVVSATDARDFQEWAVISKSHDSPFTTTDTIHRKLVIVGDKAVGKTALLWQYTRERFKKPYKPTQSRKARFTKSYFPTPEDASRKESFVVDISVDKEMVELSLWDTPGGLEIHHLHPLVAYSVCHVVLICFDIGRPDTLENVQQIWMPQIRRYCPRLPVLLVGLKLDVRDDPVTSDEPHKPSEHPILTTDGEEVGWKIGADQYFECSAKKRVGVLEVFEAAARYALEMRPEQKGDDQVNVEVEAKGQKEGNAQEQPSASSISVPPTARGKAVEQVKVKAWFDRNSFAIMRMPPRGQFSFDQLYARLAQQRRLVYRSKNPTLKQHLEIECQDESDWKHYRIENDADLEIALKVNTQLTLDVRATWPQGRE